MKQAEDVVWNTIIDRAKTRFDYTRFREGLDEQGREIVAENILFQTLVGYVEELSNEEIVSKINGDLLLLGFLFEDDDLGDFLLGKKQALETEIRATDMALSLFAQGLEIPSILVQVRSILSSNK